MKKCFFVTPIGQEGSEERKNSDDTLEFLIEPICSKNGMEVIRVDKVNDTDKIDVTIMNHLQSADLVIVDMTTHNPNVFYEFGYRHALGKPLIPIIKKGSDGIPFDVYNLRTIFYATEVRALETAKNQLDETIKNIDFEEIETTESSSEINIPLLKINDKLDTLLKAIEIRNEAEIDLIASQVAKHAKPKDDIDATLMKTVMPELLKNPDSLKQLLEISAMFPSDK
ncbi:hypothetical protein [Enterococcus wangshanyuanii]|uniref:Nucleoside 2-deoxyribosyltransferase n=1 Tax=Enterococcus wangshanyuanii TaxID=2005703 RepID=A0ABQ1NEK5_9ENTE|nr:hypothetical protein [Enterococcus wangshanyuanii]GGC74724.1 hypothetical protein GCM10011573_00300 [Enterococcus wangshanyuanii]